MRRVITFVAVLAVLSGVLFAQTNTTEKASWTVWDMYTRTPVVGHSDKKVTYKCKFCGWTKTFSWDEVFWKNEDEPVLMKHLETFHVDDIRKAATNAPPDSANSKG